MTRQVEKKKTNIFNKILEIISGIFIPIINIMMAASLIKGFLMLAVSIGIVDQADGVYILIYTISDAFFYFLPIFLAYSAAKKLDAEPYTSVLIAAALLYPGITELFSQGIGLDFLGLQIKAVNYPSSVIPIILAVFMQSYIEKPLEKYLPTVLKGFLKPMLTLLLVIPITFLFFGPIGTLMGEALTNAYGYLYELSPIFTGIVFGGIWQLMVVFGIQWGFVPVMIENINQHGMDTILPMIGPGVFAQAGAALAVSILAKGKKLKSRALSGSITALFGVTEPILYTVNVPLKRPMLAGCIAAAVGGGIIGSSSARAIAYATPSVVSMVVYFGEGFWHFLFACILSFVLAFLLTLFFRFKEEDLDQKQD